VNILKKINQKINLSFLYIIFFCLVWSSSLFYQWKYDFSIYSILAYLSNNEETIFKNYFEHKGPFYFLFLGLIYKIIGYGKIQIYISLFATIFLCFYAHYYILKKKIKKNTYILWIILLTIGSVFYNQDANASVVLFTYSFLIISIYNYSIYLDQNKINNFYYGSFFFSLALLSRIDIIFFSPTILCLLIIKYRNKKDIILKLFISLLIFCLLFLIFKIFYRYSFFDYFENNFLFNIYYKQNFFTEFNTPRDVLKFFKIFINKIEVAQFFFPVLIFFLVINNKKKNLKNKNDFFFTIFFILNGIFTWIITGYGDGHNSLMLVFPITFFLTYWARFLELETYVKYFIFICLIYFFVDLSHKNIKNNIKFNCYKDEYCSISILLNSKIAINEIRINNMPVIGAVPYLFIFSGQKPILDITNYYFFFHNFETTNQKKQYLQFLEKENQNFLVNKNYYNRFYKDSVSKNKYLEKIMSDSVFIEDLGDFIKFKYK
jgi:hypothetical protein